MNCEFNYCVYNRKFACILDEIQVNSLGMCEACEVVAIPEKDLEKYKKRRLAEIERIWNAHDD